MFLTINQLATRHSLPKYLVRQKTAEMRESGIEPGFHSGNRQYLNEERFLAFLNGEATPTHKAEEAGTGC